MSRIRENFGYVTSFAREGKRVGVFHLRRFLGRAAMRWAYSLLPGSNTIFVTPIYEDGTFDALIERCGKLRLEPHIVPADMETDDEQYAAFGTKSGGGAPAMCGVQDIRRRLDKNDDDTHVVISTNPRGSAWQEFADLKRLYAFFLAN